MTDAEHPHAVPATLPASELEGASDADLIQLVRAGDSAAYEHLFLRHRDVAIRYARRISDSERAEDLCAEAFTKILDLLQRGKGPDVAFRAYLLTTVRTSHLNTIRAGSREELVPDHEPIARMTPTVEDPDARFDASAIYRAFEKLPERWQAALWLTSVEGLSNEEASQHLGVRVNAVASLAFRARAGLRQAYLNEHLLETTDPDCRRIVELLPNYLRNGLSSRRRATVEEHLATCTRCTTATLELTEVNGRLGAVLAPLALAGSVGGAAVGGSALGSALGSAVATVKSTVTSALVQVKAGGTALSGVLGTKAAVAATVTVIGVAVGAEVVSHDAGLGPSPSAEPEVTPRRPAAQAPTPAASGSTSPSAPDITTYVEPPQVPLRPGQPSSTPSARSTTASPVMTTPTPAPTPSTTPTEAPETYQMGVEQPTSQSYQQYGLRWERIVVPVTNPVEDTFLVVTVSRTLKAALATTAGTGWVCGTPVMNWFDGGFYATSKISCMHTGNGDGGPLVFDYRVVAGAVLTAALTPPAEVQDADLSDNVRCLQLR